MSIAMDAALNAVMEAAPVLPPEAEEIAAAVVAALAHEDFWPIEQIAEKLAEDGLQSAEPRDILRKFFEAVQE